MGVLLEVLSLVVQLYIILILVRIVIETIQMFARDWSPRGALLVIIEGGVFTPTDPPLRALRKVLPPFRLGGISFDLGPLVLVFGLSILLQILQQSVR